MTKSLDPEFRKKKIIESHRPFDPIIARAELLKRNGVFLQELNNHGPNENPTAPSIEWENFCSKWRIDIGWGGDLESLDRFVYLTEILCRRPLAQVHPVRWPSGPELRQYSIHLETRRRKLEERDPEYAGRKTEIEKLNISEKKREAMLDKEALISCFRHTTAATRSDSRGENWREIVQREDAFIYIRINPWTTKKDWEWIWPEIQYQQKKIYGKELNEREKSAFFRHMCWYDLMQTKSAGVGMSYQIIAQRWNAWDGAGTCTMSGVRRAVQEMKKYIESASSF